MPVATIACGVELEIVAVEVEAVSDSEALGRFGLEAVLVNPGRGGGVAGGSG